MGMVTAGIPQEIVLALARLCEATAFIETGTCHGDTTRWAAEHFEIVHTIERAEGLYEMHSDELSLIQGVTPHLGDSRDILPGIVSDLGDKKAVYWLDGHWSGGDTAGEHDECPVREELLALVDRSEDIILIDDAQFFLCAPPLPHDASQWPTIAEIVNVSSAAGKHPFIQVINDVIYIIPDKQAIKECLIEYAQRCASDFAIDYREFARSRSRKNIFKRLFGSKS